MKNKKGYIPFKKTIIPVISIIMIVVAALLLIYTIDYKKFKKDHVKYDNEYLIHVMYLVMDKNEVEPDITMKKTFDYDPNVGIVGMLGTSNSMVPLTKKGDYLYVDLDTFTNSNLLKNETDYVFTKHNIKGEVLDDCEYDTKTNTIKVPASYFEENKMHPIQLEIQTLLTEDEFQNMETVVNVKKFGTSKVVVKNNAVVKETAVTLTGFGSRNISKDNIHIYLNNMEHELEDDLYKIYGNEVRILYPPAQISKLDIKVDYSLIGAFAREHVSDPNKFEAIKVDGPINLHLNDTGSFSLTGPESGSKEIKYCGVYRNDNCLVGEYPNAYIWRPSAASWTYTYCSYPSAYYRFDTSSYDVYMNFSVILDTLVSEVAPGVESTSGMPDRVAFYCLNHDYDGSSNNAQTMYMSYKVVGETNHSVTIHFYTTNTYRSQDAQAYLRFEWDSVPGGLKVKKVDDLGNVVQGLSVTAVNISDANDTYTATTDANGVATFDNLNLNNKYKIYEACDQQTLTINGVSNTSLAANDIACVYPSSNPLDNGGAGYSPVEDYTTMTPITMEDIRYRYCVSVRKTKGTDNRNEAGVQFKLTIPAGVCSLYSSGYTSPVVTTGNDGIATFTHLGYCKGNGSMQVVDAVHAASIIGDNPRTVSLTKSQIKAKSSITYRGVTYNAGAIIPAMTNADFVAQENAGKVEEVCPSTSTNPIEFRDKDYVIDWVKKDMSIRNNNEGTNLSNISFTVKKGSETIRVLTTKSNYTDVDGVTKSCYKYTTGTGSDTTTTLKSDSNGETCIFNLPLGGESYTVTEEATNIYSHDPITITSSEKFSSSTGTYNNYEYLIDWNKRELNHNKSTNADGLLNGAKFTVKDAQGNVVKTKPAKEVRYDKSSTPQSKSCYVVDLLNNANNTNSEFISDNGYVCIVGLDGTKTYTVTEVDPATYYGDSQVVSAAVASKLTFSSTNNTVTIYQCPTEVKITKTTTELSSASDAYKKLIYEELSKLTFNILDENGNVLTFKYNTTSKHYEYQQAINDLTGSTDAGSSVIRLLNGVNVSSTNLSDMDLNIFINYLPEGRYTLKEVSSVNCGTSSNTPSSGSNCTCDTNSSNPGSATTEEASCSNMGYSKIGDISFTVTDENTANTVTCNKTVDNSVKVSITNKPTSVKFTKKDFYGYVTDDSVKFENDEEISAFDNITFKVRKKSTVDLSGTSAITSNVYEWFYKTANGEYRLDVLKKCTTEGQNVGGYTCTQNLHTKNGNMKLTHLCKCEDYYIEEYEVPNGTVFVLPKLEGNSCQEGYMKVNKNNKLECHPIKSIKVCDCDGDNPESSPPVIIEDLPTKQVFIKKDLKYNTIITDQTTKFELFLAKEGKTCNPYDATSKANDCIQVYFKDRVVLSDEADGSLSYRLIPETSSNNKIKELQVDPNTGKLILRYLPSYIDREYVLMETVAPRGYDLPTGEKSVTRFKVVNDTVNVEVSNVPNKPSKVIIGKYDAATGELITGVKFKVYKVNNYDENLSPMMQSKSNALQFKTIRDGSYERREVYDTSVITTCIDREGSPCSDITNTLVHDEYENAAISGSESITTIQEGQALIQYLDTDAYYVIEEVEVPTGYKLPEKESDRYTLFYIPKSEEVSVETKVFNTESFFTFFKYDEYNNVKDGATFKLQKLNKDKIYEDVAVEDVSTEDTKMYRISSESENYDITTLNGQATIYRLTEGQYRVIEVKAPEGYELPKKTYNVVTFLVDKSGHTFGSNIIANKKKTSRIELVPYDEAEFVINIQTGKKVIKYGLIITGILGLIALLIFIRKKVSK